MQNRVYLTPEELADRWKHRVSVGTLRNWRIKGRRHGPTFIKVGRAILYELRAVEEFELSSSE